MSRWFQVVAALSACLSSGDLLAQTDAKERPAFNLEALFQQGDANGDGKLSKDEFLKMTSTWPRLKDYPDRAKQIFDRLDANRDGFLSLAEFKKITSLAARPATPEAKPAEKPKTEPVEKPKIEPAELNKPPSTDQLAFFEKKIRPVLAAQCYQCHSATAEKVKGELLLDSREGSRKGGITGPAVVPGDLPKSLLIQAIRYHDKELKMPPKQPLADSVVADFEAWVKIGAPDPRENTAKSIRGEINIDKGREFWAFQPVRQALPPAVNDAAWPSSEVDRFLLAGLEAKQLKPVKDADKLTLLRRIYYDLIGLPPTPEEISAFLADHSDKALEKLVDKLLASKQYGERWGRHWLDVARFAESSGKQANFAYPHAWRYRDYVIAAFNADKPYDQFIREQLAGDLLPAKDDQEKAERLIATGFLAIGSKSHNERNPLQFQLDMVDEQIDATFVAFQGLTVACARCHDHKFDPIPTKDYYALAGIFRSSETCYGTIRTVQSNFPSPLIALPSGAGAPAMIEPLAPAARAALERQLKDLKDQQAKLSASDRMTSMAGVRFRILSTNLESKLAMYQVDGTPKSQAMGVREKYFPADSKLFVRGEIEHPGENVPRGFPQALTRTQPHIARGSGRLELANWLASKENPLTARVMVNRIWQHLFGRGLVATPDNFGAAGEHPSNAALLDYLAGSFADSGWSVKTLIRTLVLSRAYQLSSTFDAKDFEADPDNTLVWRMNKRRLEAEALRDSMLSVSGLLDPSPPKTDALAKNGEGIVQVTFRFRPIDSYTSDYYRSVYLPIARDQLPEALTLFDFPDPTLMAGERNVTTIPGQSLFLMNNPFVIKQAEVFALNLLSSGGEEAEKIERAYLTAFTRPPTAKERAMGHDFLEKYAQRLVAQGTKESEAHRSSWTVFCQSLFASAEFSHR